MDVGITGSKGFLGSHLSGRLKSNSRISSVEGFDLPEGDLFDKEALNHFVEGKDVIVHLGALNRADDVELMRVNLVGTFALVNAIKTINPDCRLIFSSSFQVYSKSKEDDIIDEDFETAPLSVYGFSKKFGEDLIRSQLKYHAIMRISNIYGPGCRPFYNAVTATFIQLAKDGKPIDITGSGEQSRDFVFVDDVVDALELAVLSEETGIFNVCSGESVSLNMLADILKKSFPDIEVNHKDSGEEVIKTRGSYGKIKSAMSWEPKTLFEEGMKKYL